LGWLIDSYIGTALLTDIARLLITIYVGEDSMMEAKESERYIEEGIHYWMFIGLGITGLIIKS
jgi:hypothetical protein